MAQNHKFRHLLLKQEQNGVLEVTLNRPHVLNAWNAELCEDLVALWRHAGEHADIRVVLLTGAGTAFSVGGDIDYLETGLRDTNIAANSTIGEYVSMMRAMIDLDKPIVTAINGHAVGGGVGLALMADVSFMSERARLLCGGQLNLNVPPAEAPFLWPLLLSMAKAKYHLFATDFIDAAEAERIGLVSAAVPHDELMPRARNYSDRLSKQDPMALGWTKRALNHWLRAAAPILDFALATEALGFRRPEAAAGLEKMRKLIGAPSETQPKS